MENKIFIPLMLIICALVIISLYFFMNNTTDQKECENIENTTEKINCYNRLLNKTQNSSICENIKENNIRDRCYVHLAFLKKDFSICNKCTSSNLKQKCYSKINMSKINLTFCQKLSKRESLLQCYTNLAIKKENSSYCTKLGLFTTKKPLYSIYNSRKIYGTQKDYCYYKFADNGRRNQEKERINTCKKIKNLDIKNTCYTEFAQTFNEPGFCDNLKNQALQEDCIEITNLDPD